MINQNKTTRTRTCSKKETVSLPLSRSTWNFKKKLLFHIHFGSMVENKNKKKLESGHYTVLNSYIQGAPRKQHCFLRRAPKISRKSDFSTCNLGELCILKFLYTRCSTKEAISGQISTN